MYIYIVKWIKKLSLDIGDFIYFYVIGNEVTYIVNLSDRLLNIVLWWLYYIICRYYKIVKSWMMYDSDDGR